MNKLTPREPTPEMISKARRVEGVDALVAATVWRAMHDAAPKVEAEPVAWMDDFGNAFPLAANKRAGSWLDEHKRNWTPLYTRPAAPQPGALPGLSDAEIDRLWDESANIPIGKGWTVEETRYHYLARAVIAALKGKQ